MKYKFSGELTFDDYMQFQMMYLKGIVFTKKTITIFVLLIGIVTFCLFKIIKEGYLKNISSVTIFGSVLFFTGTLLAIIYSKRIYQKPFEINQL